jgi:Bacterial protein of unknown function (DUF839)
MNHMNGCIPTNRHSLRASICGLAVSLPAIISAQSGCYTDVKPYAVAVSPDYTVQPLISVGERVPNTSNPSKEFQMIGIPDGLGATKGKGNTTLLYMNHELSSTVLSEPNVGGPLNRGAFISEWTLDPNGCVISGQRAYNTVVDEEFGVTLPAAEVGNSGRPFGRFCSGSLSFREAGFDRPIYLTGEESGGSGTFDGRGGLGVAVFDGKLHTLVKMGRFSWENTLARPDAGEYTVVMGMEDGPATLDNQLYMYVGKKSRDRGASVLSRNGLDTGKLYTFVCDTPGQTGENTFTSGSITGHWVELPDQTNVSETNLEAQSDAAGAFTFVRIEDGAWSKTDKNTFYFVTTGSGAANVLGRSYQVKFDRTNILGMTTIEMLYNADTVSAAGGDIGFAPDNMEASRNFLMIQEDGTSQSRPQYASRAREGSIWRHSIADGFAAKRVVELNPPGTVAVAGSLPPAVLPGVWETSGIIDASPFFGQDSWLFVVQAHSPSIAPVPNSIEDGQLLIMRPSCKPLALPGNRPR